MKYYQAQKEVYNRQLDDYLIQYELLTPGEIKKAPWKKAFCKIVYARKNNSYWCFGARFNSDLREGIND